MKTATVSSPAPAGLTAGRAVERRLVHKLAIEEVYVTGAAALDDGSYLALTQLPRAHRLFGDVTLPYHDLGMVGEAARQAVMVVLHELLNVPVEARLVIGSVRVALEDLEANRIGALPTEMAVQVRFDPLRWRRDGSLRGVSGAAECSIGGVHSGTFEGQLMLFPGKAYESLRSAALKPAEEGRTAAALLNPAAVARTDPRNVLLAGFEAGGDGTFRALVVADPADRVFFDHPQDHHPGMLLLEAGRQMAMATAARELELDGRLVAREVQATFAQFAGFDAPLTCTATAVDRSASELRLRMVMWEGDTEVAQLSATVVDAAGEGRR